MMKEMGISFLNASTILDKTTYMNDIPSNQLEKWVLLEAERFKNPQFRAFHTELETVYEELNSIIDSGPRSALFKMFETLLPEGKNGYKNPIGTIEHVKNPSLTEIKKYYEKYYVPNNMAIVIVGDFDPDKATELIEQHFSYMEPKPLPVEKTPKIGPLSSPKEVEIFNPGAERLTMGYRHGGSTTEEGIMAEFIEMMMLNGQAGIFDLNINEAQKALNISTYLQWYNDYSVHVIQATPKKGQSLEELRDVILEEIDRLKTGDFPDWLLEAVTNDLKTRFMSELTYNANIAAIMTDSFVFDNDLENIFSKFEKFEKIKKSDIMNYAKKHYDNSHAIVYKKDGPNKNKKVVKPSITSLSTVNKGKKSSFRKKIEAIGVMPIQPKLVDFKNDIKELRLNNGTKVHIAQNKDNDLFNLRIVFYQGNSDKVLRLAGQYIKLADTDKFTAKELKSELYKIGTTFYFNTYSDKTALFVNGLTENFKKSMALVSHLLSSVQIDEDIFESVRQSENSKIENQKKSSYDIRGRMLSHVMYGPEGSYRSMITKNELKNITINDVVGKIRDIRNYQHDIYFYGTKDHKELKEILSEAFETKESLLPLERKSDRVLKDVTSNTVYLLDAKGTQLQVSFSSKLKDYDPKYIAITSLFSKYFNTLIFNEIRDSRGLAYIAYGNILQPLYYDDAFNFYTIVETQADKYKEVLEVNHDLIRNLPIDEPSFLSAKKELQEKWDSQRITKSSILYHYETAQNRGMDYDPRRNYFDTFPDITLEDFKAFYNEWIKNNYLNLVIIGDLSQINKDDLKKYGTVKVLTKEEIFGKNTE